MTIAPENRRKGPRLLAGGALVLVAAAWAASCASTETVAFSDGDCVGNGCVQSSSSSSSTSASSATSASSGGMCTVNTSCKVSWATDVFAGILDTTTVACTGTGLCHGSGKGGLQLTAGMAHEAYVALTGLTLKATPGPAKPYIVPCDPNGSGMLCNMKPEMGSTNPYGACGSLMPTFGTNLTMDQLNTIADWIACGAPEN